MRVSESTTQQSLVTKLLDFKHVVLDEAGAMLEPDMVVCLRTILFLQPRMQCIGLVALHMHKAKATKYGCLCRVLSFMAVASSSASETTARCAACPLVLRRDVWGAFDRDTLTYCYDCAAASLHNLEESH